MKYLSIEFAFKMPVAEIFVMIDVCVRDTFFGKPRGLGLSNSRRVNFAFPD